MEMKPAGEILFFFIAELFYKDSKKGIWLRYDTIIVCVVFGVRH